MFPCRLEAVIVYYGILHASDPVRHGVEFLYNESTKKLYAS